MPNELFSIEMQTLFVWESLLLSKKFSHDIFSKGQGEGLFYWLS